MLLVEYRSFQTQLSAQITILELLSFKYIDTSLNTQALPVSASRM